MILHWICPRRVNLVVSGRLKQVGLVRCPVLRSAWQCEVENKRMRRLKLRLLRNVIENLAIDAKTTVSR